MSYHNPDTCTPTPVSRRSVCLGAAASVYPAVHILWCRRLRLLRLGRRTATDRRRSVTATCPSRDRLRTSSGRPKTFCWGRRCRTVRRKKRVLKM